jgi:N-acetylmuramoyl-L-alanine amidase
LGLKVGLKLGLKEIFHPGWFLVCLLPLCFAPAVHAQLQTIQGPGVVVRSFQEDIARGTLTLKLDRPAQIGRPIFRYLPGANGETILSADFEGLQWVAPTAVFRPYIKDKANFIREVHLGQWQVSPAVMRLSFISANPQVLKKVSIAAGEGVLKISWPVAGNEASSVVPAPTRALVKGEVLPPVAPSLRSKAKLVSSGKQKDEVQLTELPNSGASGWMKRWKSKASNFFSFDGKQNFEQEKVEEKVPEKVAQKLPQNLAQNLPSKTDKPILKSNEKPEPKPALKLAPKPTVKLVENSQPAAENKVEKNEQAEELPAQEKELAASPVITYEVLDSEGSQQAVLRVDGGNALSFKSFRLHGPERYVMDIKGARSILNSQLPEINDSPLVNAIRVGVLEQDAQDGRLVLELKDDTISVEEVFNEGSSSVTLTLGKGLGLDSAGILRNSVGATTGGAVAAVVPRVSGEPLIVVDAGHGGHDPGAMRGDVQEKELTLGIALKLKKALEAKGARVVMTRSDDTFVSLEERVKITNSVQPDVFISVHINSLESTSNIYGVETYFQNGKSKTLADKVHGSLVANLAVPDRFVRKARFYVINHTPVPAILAEVGYITNKNERTRLISSDYQGKVAGALARGVMLYLQDEKGTADIASKSQPRNPQMAVNPGAKSVK